MKTIPANDILEAVAALCVTANHELPAEPTITTDAREILDRLPPITTTGH